MSFKFLGKSEGLAFDAQSQCAAYVVAIMTSLISQLQQWLRSRSTPPRCEITSAKFWDDQVCIEVTDHVGPSLLAVAAQEAGQIEVDGNWFLASKEVPYFFTMEQMPLQACT